MPEEQQAKKESVSAEALAAARLRAKKRQAEQESRDPCIRAENEDDDGYDPYSDRRPEREPLFSEDPWR